MPPPRRRVVLRESLLLVAEGDAEIALIRHVRDLYTRGNRGRSVTHRNAHGYGAGHVVDTAISLKSRGDFTVVAAMVDTDTGWDARVQARARRAGVIVLASDPCLEASLLGVVGLAVVGDQRAQKERFRRQFGGDAHAVGLIQRSFTEAALNDARGAVPFIDDLLTVIGV